MKVMYLAFEGFDTQNGTNHLAIKMLDTFINNGIDVYLVSSHTTGANNDIPDILIGRNGFSYDIVNRKIVNKQNFVDRYIDGFKYSFKAMKRWRKHRKEVDAVILQSCPTVFFSSVLLKLFLRKPVIFNYYDIFPNGPRAYGAINNNMVYTVLHMAQKIVYKNSTKIVAISKDTKNTLIKEGIREDKIEVIHNWYDINQVKKVLLEDNKFVKKYNLETDNKFILQYAGNFGYTFDYKSIIEIAKKMKDYKDIEIHMIGTGGFEREFKEVAEINDLDNIKFFPWQPAEISSDVYSYCDLEIIPLSKGVIYTSYPSKTSLLMACGKTFMCITEENSEFYREINEKEVGICVPRENYDKAVESILSVYNDREKLDDMGKRAEEYGEVYFSSKKNVGKYIEILNSMSNLK